MIVVKILGGYQLALLKWNWVILQINYLFLYLTFEGPRATLDYTRTDSTSNDERGPNIAKSVLEARCRLNVSEARHPYGCHKALTTSLTTYDSFSFSF